MCQHFDFWEQCAENAGPLCTAAVDTAEFGAKLKLATCWTNQLYRHKLTQAIESLGNQAILNNVFIL